MQAILRYAFSAREVLNASYVSFIGELLTGEGRQTLQDEYALAERKE
jgi:hypothetical protein